ncbi:MAG: hypothetical protein ABJC13_08435 [Acidobacteriota bacterium]
MEPKEPKAPVPVPCHALRVVRVLLRIGQGEAGLRLGRLSLFREVETGRAKVIGRRRYQELAGSLNPPPGVIEIVYGLTEAVSGFEQADPWISPPMALVIEGALVDVLGELRYDLVAEARAARFAAEREEAEHLWQILAACDPERRPLVAARPMFWTWGLAERLCQESLAAAPHDPAACRALAELALEVASNVTGPERFLDFLAAFCWAHLGNAQRVQGDLEAADAAFAEVERLLPAVEEGEVIPLDLTRIPNLKASLRRNQRRFAEALACLESIDVSGDLVLSARVAVQTAGIYQQAGNFEAAIATLREALPLVDAGTDDRLRCVTRFNLAANLIYLDRVAEMEALMPEVRALAFAQNHDVDMLRLEWLEAILAAAHGRRTEAIEALADILDRFHRRKMSFDAALAALELSALLLEAGRPAEAARRLAGVLPTFHAHKARREELASLWLFLQAIERQVATAALARAAAVAWRSFGVEAV